MRKFVGVAILTLVATLGAKADSLVFNTGPGASSGGWTIANETTPVFSSNYYEDLAAEISLSSPTTITAMDGWFSPVNLGPGVSSGLVEVALFTDSGNPSSPLGSWIVSEDMSIVDGSGTNWYGVSGLNAAVSAGDYWIVFSSDTRNFDTYMPGVASPLPESLLGFDYITANGMHPTGSQAGIEVYGNTSGATGSVPDSASTVLLLACGLIGLAVAATRRTRQMA
jgi:hypothetical protein